MVNYKEIISNIKDWSLDERGIDAGNFGWKHKDASSKVRVSTNKEEDEQLFYAILKEVEQDYKNWKSYEAIDELDDDGEPKFTVYVYEHILGKKHYVAGHLGTNWVLCATYDKEFSVRAKYVRDLLKNKGDLKCSVCDIKLVTDGKQKECGSCGWCTSFYCESSNCEVRKRLEQDQHFESCELHQKNNPPKSEPEDQNKPVTIENEKDENQKPTNYETWTKEQLIVKIEELEKRIKELEQNNSQSQELVKTKEEIGLIQKRLQKLNQTQAPNLTKEPKKTLWEKDKVWFILTGGIVALTLVIFILYHTTKGGKKNK